MTMQTVVFSSTISLLFFLASPLLAGERTDVIIMKNSDRITCEVKSLSSDRLTVSLDYVDGDVSLQWSKVARLNSHRLFIVQTEDGSVYTGRISTADTPGGQPVRIQVAVTPDKRVELDQLQVVKIRETSQNFWQRFNGGVETRIIFSKGNDSTQYSIGTHVEYPRERWLARANLDSALSANSKSNNSTRNQFETGVVRLLRWNNWFYQGLHSFLQSSVQGIHLQTTLGGGIGHYLLNTNSTKISVTGGLAWQNTAYNKTTPLQTTQNLAAGLVFAEAKFFTFKKTNLDATALLIPALSEPTACASTRMYPITSSSLATCRGIRPFTGAGTTAHLRAFPAVTTAQVPDCAGSLATGDGPRASCRPTLHYGDLICIEYRKS